MFAIHRIRAQAIIAAIALALALPSHAGDTAKDFVRAQAARTAIVTDATKIAFLAGEMFRFDTIALLRMSHPHWTMPEDAFLNEQGFTFGYEVRSTADRTEYDARRLRAAIDRNHAVDQQQKAIAIGMLELLDKLVEHSHRIGELYDAGDATATGDYYLANVVPVYESIRRGHATIASEVGNQVKLNALKFRD